MTHDPARFEMEAQARDRDAYGALYAATDRRSGEPVYVKVLRSNGRETHAEHPYEGLLDGELILPLEEVDAGGARMVVLPRPEGELLAHCLPRLRRGGLAGRHTLLRVLAEAAHGLDRLHRAGLVHGQVSPAAIQVRETAPMQSFLLCFGPAAPRPGHLYVAENPNLLYVSCEKLRGGGDRASDIYAIGMLLYVGFGKTAPFRGESPYDVAEAILRGDCEPFEPELDDISPSVHAAVRPELETIGSVALKALQRDPRARYATIGELARVLDGLAARLSPVEIGVSLYEAGKHELAALVLEQATDGPDAARAWVYLGKACSEGLRDYERGLVAFRRAIRHNPDLVAAREGLIEHYASFGHLTLARREMLELVAADPENVLLMMRYADLVLRSGEADEAVSIYRRVLELNPYHLAAYARVVALELNRGNLQSADSFCVAALEKVQQVVGKGNLEPAAVADIYALRAKVMRQKGFPDRAVAWAERAIAAFPAHEEGHTLLAELYLQAGDDEKAIPHLLAALTFAPGGDGILDRLARLMNQAAPQPS